MLPAMQNLSKASSMRESHVSSITEGPTTLILGYESEDNSAWPFNWATVDVPGSPGLSRLFTALEIECSVPPLPLDAQLPEELHCISDTQLLDLWNIKNQSQRYEIDAFYSPIQQGTTLKPKRNQCPSLPWRIPAYAFCGWSSSPLDEMYVFPRLTYPCGRRVDSERLSWAMLEAQAADLQIKLSKLQPLLGSAHPKILATAAKLAKVYRQQGMYAKQERLLLHLVNTMGKAYGADDIKTLDAWQNLVDCLLERAHIQEAETILNEINPTIRGLVDPRHSVATRASHQMANAASYLGDYEKAETLLREVLQIRLDALGPRSSETWRSMAGLGWVISHLGHHPEAERLLQHTLQLQSEISELGDEDFYVATSIMADNCYYQERHEESEALCRRSIERLKAFFGPDHLSLSILQGQLARSFTKQGRHVESADMYWTVLSQLSRSLGESHQYTLYFVRDFTLTLETIDRLDEAAT